ncbi:MAG: hypothetical protein HWE39_12265 [Oceanospirillaceae bacterium]|nr:hypothetical protein [Oceanospirillaceae bacterium]
MDKTRNTLLVITALCLAGSLLVYALIFAQQQVLLNEVKENPLWAAHQLERESHDFRTLLMALGENPADEALAEKARLRFDVLYSRLSVVSHGLLGGIFNNLPKAGGEVDHVRALLDEIDRQLFSTLDADVLAALNIRARQLTEITGRILLDTLEYSISVKAERRKTLSRLVIYLGLLILLVVVGTTLLVFMLVRQVREVRQAHAETLELAQNLDRSAEQARQAGREQSAFLRALCLEIRARLESAGEGSGGRQQTEAAANALLTLLDQVTELSALDSPDYELREQAFNLRSLLDELQQVFQRAAFDKGLSLAFEVADGAGGSYMGDADCLKRALTLLIDNAIRYTPRGRVRIRVVAEHTAPETSEMLFEVEDSGIGIDAATRRVLFGAFGQVGEASAGAGLGLVLCRAIVARMQGHLDVDSTPGSGSRFWFRVPLHRLTPQGLAGASGNLSGPARNPETG